MVSTKKFWILCVGVLWTAMASSVAGAAASPGAAGDKKEAAQRVAVEGFSAEYSAVPTPQAQWADGSVETWLRAFRAQLHNEKTLAYRGNVLPAGRHQVWIEKGTGEWFHLFVGDKNDSDRPRLKALFRLYELEKGVSSMRLELKLTGRKTKLKFSLFAGKHEGHGNLRILEEGQGGSGKDAPSPKGNADGASGP
ncbi:MAG: hypothetical protein AAF581_21330 [Planctomycetota bacterium]